MPVNPKIIQVGKQLLTSLASQIPRTVFGIEKQRYIGLDIVNTMSGDQKLVLIKLMNSILLRMREVDASDVDLGGWAAKNMVWYRIHGAKKPIKEFGTFTIDEMNVLIQSLLMESQRQELYELRNLDFSYSFEFGANKTHARYRADAYLDLDALALNMRSINTQIRPYESFGFSQQVTKILNLAYTKEGLILVTGITGSGKSTTLDAIVDLNNRTVDAHIIIIASPIEFVHESKRCIIRHREVGRDTLSFKQGTVEALRQDPDIIIIGEMRDPDTIISALEVVDSGHKVLSTLHTSSAVESIDRIIAEVPSVEQERVRARLSDVLRCVISQKLVPSRDGRRVLAKEIMVVTPSVRAAIKNNNINEIYQMIGEGGKYGMCTMEQDLKRLYLERKITIETAFSFANNKRRMQQLLNPQV